MTISKSWKRLIGAIVLAAGAALQPVAHAQIPGSSLPNLPVMSSLPILGAPASPVINRDFNVNGMKRSALVRIPAGARNAPVVFAFGGWNQTAEDTRVAAALEGVAPNAVIVYPRGIGNAWEGAPYAQTKRGQDVALVRTIVDTLSREGVIDRNRVYANGISNGGGMVTALACQAPDLVRAVSSISGAYYEHANEGCANTSVPTLMIHGTHDDVVSINGGQRHGAPYFSAYRVLADVSIRNKCHVAGAPQSQPAGINVERLTYPGCANETALLRVFPGTHNFMPMLPIPAQATWDFFSRH